MEEALGADGHGLLEQHDALVGLVAEELQGGEAAGRRHVEMRPAARGYDKAFCRRHAGLLPCGGMRISLGSMNIKKEPVRAWQQCHDRQRGRCLRISVVTSPRPRAPLPPPLQRRAECAPDLGDALDIPTVNMILWFMADGVRGQPVTMIDGKSIAATHAVIKPYVRATPIAGVSGADFGLSRFSLVLKLEHLQHSGSFKARGAFANLLLRRVPPVGVVAASGGNHGAAVAYAARRLGARAKIFVPTVSSPVKIQRIREYGADLVVGGDRYADALAASEAWAAESGALPVHAFDQVETLLGQGTIGAELTAQTPSLDTVLVA